MEIPCAVSGQLFFQSTFLLCLRSPRLPGPTPRKSFPVFLSQGPCPSAVRGVRQGWLLKQPVHLLLRTMGAASSTNHLPAPLLRALGLRLANRRDARRDGVKPVTSGLDPVPLTHLIKPSDSSVQTVGPIVDGQLILLPVQCECSFGNPIGHPANHGSKVGLLLEVACKDRGGQFCELQTEGEAHTAIHHFLLRAAAKQQCGSTFMAAQRRVFSTHDLCPF